MLGQGGFGRVYLAYDPVLRREVAVKVPLPGEASRFLDLQAYLREAQIVARLSHPNIVPVYDVGHLDDGSCFVVSRFMPGGDLKARLEHGRPSFAESADLVAVLCDALQYTHTQDLFHRDIKPGNILLDADGVPSLADFGLALRDEDVGRGARYLGTAAYMSPEQARGEGHRVDGRSDIFSIGVVLYELLTGRRPFRGTSNREIMQQVIGGEPRPPRQIDETIPPELERVCLKAMAKRAPERYPTARDLGEDLRHFLASVSWAAPTAELPQATVSMAERPIDPVPPETDPGPRPIRIVPRGLGSYDQQDADFFLELMPGPRDRDGLPDGLRFWKTRIESTDPDRAFRVGLIYGPSGCGKSSMVKAGLLPRLAPHVGSIYVEAAAADTEARLNRALRRLFPSWPAGAGLAEGLTIIRRGRGLPDGRKLLLVLDQFEQWLFARRGEDDRGDGLIDALRQCDGERIQALCLIRDDFWMAATRFMRELDVDLLPGANLAAVDLFEPRHARKVLAAYGRAFETLPPGVDALSRDQEAFLDAAIAGLAQDGRIVPVRLALFAEMVKGRPWTPATLREVGGMDGVGVRFLDDSFSSARSDPIHRYHQKAAQAVLKALLPESNTDIKGRMRPVSELREISGYGGRRADFAGLIRMLDGELRLITPVDPESSVDEETPSADVGGRCYQLTHDYLVHALREWLTRRQRETRRGRAELLLSERAALWNAGALDRYLPSTREWASIRLFTKPRDWSEAQRRMMRRGGRVIALRACVASALLAVAVAAGLAGLDRYHKANADALLGALITADTADATRLIGDLREYRRWAEPELRRLVRQSPDGSRKKLHVSLALLPIDPDQRDYLRRRLLAAGPKDMEIIGDHLVGQVPEQPAQLWRDLGSARPGHPSILPLAGVLARYAASDPRWKEVADKVARSLVYARVADVAAWRDALRPVKSDLSDHLARLFGEIPPGQMEHKLAAELLADYAVERPALLAAALLDADADSFAVLLRGVKSAIEDAYAAGEARQAEALGVLIAAVNEARTLAGGDDRSPDIAPPGGPGARPEEIEAARDRLARRGAHAAAALLQLDHPDQVWRILEYSRDPRARTACIATFSALGVNPEVLAAELERADRQRSNALPPDPGNDHLLDPITSRRRALLLALAAYRKQDLDDRFRSSLARRLEAIYLDDPDAGIHAAAELVLRRWGLEGRLKPQETTSTSKDHIGRRWYVNSESQTMVVVEGPVRFRMGSPASDPERQVPEYLHWREIGRRFAISSKEVTIAEFRRFELDARKMAPARITRYSPTPDCPIINVRWYDAAEYCNWLSKREGLDPCYIPLPARAGQVEPAMEVDPEAIRRGGYRLPTEAEWEYACRARSATSRYFGGVPEILGEFEWFIGNSGDHAHPCGTRWPNELGLFDMLGNASEWCHDRHPNPSLKEDAVLKDIIERETVSGGHRLVRGMNFHEPVQSVRSAARSWLPPAEITANGFRLATTLPGRPPAPDRRGGDPVGR